MEDQPRQVDTSPARSGSDPAFLDTIAGRLAVVVIAAVLLAGAVAAILVLRDRGDASASHQPVESADPSEFVVTGAEVVSVDPPSITGVCPVEVRFTGEFQTSGGSGTVVYQWFFSDAGPTEPQSVDLPSGERSVTVELTREFGGSDARYRDMTEQVEILVLEQNGKIAPVSSTGHSFTIACT